MTWTLEAHVGNVVGVTGVHLPFPGSPMGVTITGGLAGVVVKYHFIHTGTWMFFAAMASLLLLSAFSRLIVLPSSVLFFLAVIPVMLIANDNPMVCATLVFIMLQFSFSAGLGGAVGGQR